MTPGIYVCIISTCPWQHPATQPESIVTEWGAPTSRFLFEELIAAARIDDDAIADHLGTHSFLDWTAEIDALRQRLDQVVAAYNSAMQVLRAMAASGGGVRMACAPAVPKQFDTDDIRFRLAAVADSVQKVNERND